MKAPKTINGIASAVAKIEGKKSQARIGDIREILGILSDMVYTGMYGSFMEGSFYGILHRNGERRAKLVKRKTKKKKGKKK